MLEETQVLMAARGEREERLVEEDTPLLQDQKEGQNEETVAPDGGWGWVVMVASFFCNFVLDGNFLVLVR